LGAPSSSLLFEERIPKKKCGKGERAQVSISTANSQTKTVMGAPGPDFGTWDSTNPHWPQAGIFPRANEKFFGVFSAISGDLQGCFTLFSHIRGCAFFQNRKRDVLRLL
jgi:hypothetical protein